MSLLIPTQQRMLVPRCLCDGLKCYYVCPNDRNIICYYSYCCCLHVSICPHLHILYVNVFNSYLNRMDGAYSHSLGGDFAKNWNKVRLYASRSVQSKSSFAFSIRRVSHKLHRGNNELMCYSWRPRLLEDCI